MDSQLLALRRSWEAEPTLEAGLAFLRAANRVGHLDGLSLRVACWLGDPLAVEALGIWGLVRERKAPTRGPRFLEMTPAQGCLEVLLRASAVCVEAALAGVRSQLAQDLGTKLCQAAREAADAESWDPETSTRFAADYHEALAAGLRGALPDHEAGDQLLSGLEGLALALSRRSNLSALQGLNAGRALTTTKARSALRKQLVADLIPWLYFRSQTGNALDELGSLNEEFDFENTLTPRRAQKVLMEAKPARALTDYLEARGWTPKRTGSTSWGMTSPAGYFLEFRKTTLKVVVAPQGLGAYYSPQETIPLEAICKRLVQAAEGIA